MAYLLDKSLEHVHDMDIMNINDLCRCVFNRQGNVCTFVNCRGNTFAVGPDGSIYPCYRFVGMPEYVMGSVYDHPSREDLEKSDAWKLMHQFRDYVDTACGECKHIKYCRGGCPYNAIAPTNGVIQGVDPHCIAYKRIFDEITDRLNKEMFDSPMMEMSFTSQPMKRKKPGVMSLIHKMVSG